ncbi:MAG TPA: glycosyl hydrolase family 28-related protein [Polyangiaceae bacterium]|jgi:hypothetical protein|nr:glycosyl hydrolase family 28-related protein [Polyangiaceae bacterium]
MSVLRCAFLFALLAVDCRARVPRAPLAHAPTSTQIDQQLPAILRDRTPYLPDYSYAGYHFGERSLPVLAATLDVTSFGAHPDDTVDDTTAIQAALRAANQQSGAVVLHFPKGRFTISQTLYLERSHLVLQGSGSGDGGTVLVMTKSLSELPRDPRIEKLEAYLVKNDKRVDGKPFSPFSWTGGLLWTRVAQPLTEPALTTAISGRRGEHRVTLSSSLALLPGEIIRLRWFNHGGNDSPLLHHIFGLSRIDFGPRLSGSEAAVASEEATIAAVNDRTLTLVQPLLHDIEPEFAVELSRPQFLEEVGIEHLAIEFPNQPYAGHHLERGNNGIYLTGLSHSWVRDVRVENADSALLSDECANVTLTQIDVRGRNGHYGVHLGDTFDLLLNDFRIEAEEFHSVSFNTHARADVVTRGEIFRPSLDQHRGANQQNLFDDLSTREDRGKSLLFEHGGADYYGPTSAAFNTFWNVHVEFSSNAPSSILLGRIEDAGPARLIGLSANRQLELDYARAEVEDLGQAELGVPSLYRYQLERRLNAERADQGSLPNTNAPR